MKILNRWSGTIDKWMRLVSHSYKTAIFSEPSQSAFVKNLFKTFTIFEGFPDIIQMRMYISRLNNCCINHSSDPFVITDSDSLIFHYTYLSLSNILNSSSVCMSNPHLRSVSWIIISFTSSSYLWNTIAPSSAYLRICSLSISHLVDFPSHLVDRHHTNAWNSILITTMTAALPTIHNLHRTRLSQNSFRITGS